MTGVSEPTVEAALFRARDDMVVMRGEMEVSTQEAFVDESIARIDAVLRSRGSSDPHTHGPFAGPYSSCPACSSGPWTEFFRVLPDEDYEIDGSSAATRSEGRRGGLAWNNYIDALAAARADAEQEQTP